MNAQTADLLIISAAWLADRLAAKIAADRAAKRNADARAAKAKATGEQK